MILPINMTLSPIKFMGSIIVYGQYYCEPFIPNFIVLLSFNFNTCLIVFLLRFLFLFVSMLEQAQPPTSPA